MTETLDLGEPRGVVHRSFSSEMRKSYIDYAMSVIVSRALPDVRDGLKPVHRRIVFGMDELKINASQPHKKSARIVGEVIGKYHPHGDSAVYLSMVRMAQPFSLREPLIDGHGNFGSLDGDSPAAMRYTEARMTRLAMTLTQDLDPAIVPFRPNYDSTEREPVVMPARFPNILVNGGIGIAVGMASSIPTHNLVESINACLLVLEDETVSLDKVLEVLPGPDFPTKGVILGRGGIRQAYEAGRGSIAMRGVARIEDRGRGRQQIIISELPYMVNKKDFVTRLHELATDKSPQAIQALQGITEVRDESDIEDMVRVVVDVKADADASVILNGISKHTDFRKNFGYNATCLDSRGRPREMPLLDILREFVQFRRQIVRARTQHELDGKRAEQIKQIGLFAAVSMIDEVVAIIRSSSDAETALVRLMQIDFPVNDTLRVMIQESDPDATPGEFFRLSDVQADHILKLQLRSLTALESEKIVDAVRQLQAEIRVCLEILGDIKVLSAVVAREMIEIRDKFGSPRITSIEEGDAEDLDDDSMVERKDVVVTLTKQGYVKRTELDLYRAQKRGGKGKIGMDTKDDDYVVSTIVCTTRTPLLVFTSNGQAYSIKAYRLTEAGANAKGRPIVNMIPHLADSGDRVTAILPLPEEREEFEHMSLVFITDFGTIRRNRVTDFLDLRKTGKIAMKLDSEDGGKLGRLVDVLLADDSQDVLIATSDGMSIRYPVSDVRVSVGRDSKGIRAINLRNNDKVVSAIVLTHTDADTLERDVYLSGGVKFVNSTALQNDAGEMRAIPAGITLTPAPDAENPDRVKLVLAPERSLQMQAEETMLLSVSQFGYGKRTSSHEYRVASRGGVGIAAAVLNDRTGSLAALIPVAETDGLVLVTDGGQTIRTKISQISVHGRNTRGVRLLSIPEGQSITGVARIQNDAGDDEPEDEATLIEG